MSFSRFISSDVGDRARNKFTKAYVESLSLISRMRRTRGNDRRGRTEACSPRTSNRVNRRGWSNTIDSTVLRKCNYGMQLLSGQGGNGKWYGCMSKKSFYSNSNIECSFLFLSEFLRLRVSFYLSSTSFILTAFVSHQRSLFHYAAAWRQ